MNRILAIGLWTLFAAAIALHFYIGGVVVDGKVDGSQHFIMLRENRDVWIAVSMATYWAHFAIKYLMFTVCMSVAAWAVRRWKWHGGFRD